MKKVFGFTFNICLSLFIFGLLFASCIRKKQEFGKLSTKEIKTESFKDIEIHDNISVKIIPGNTTKVVLKGKEKLVKETEVKVKDDVLILSNVSDKFNNKREIDLGRHDGYDYFIEAIITIPTLRKIKQVGNSSIDINKPITGDNVDFNIFGNSSIDITGLTAKKLTMKLEGNASIDLSKLTINDLNMNIMGNSSADIDFALGNNVNVDVLGNCSVTLKGVTRNKPIYTMRGMGSIDDQTTRAK
jgi:hypothetical protein